MMLMPMTDAQLPYAGFIVVVHVLLLGISRRSRLDNQLGYMAPAATDS